MQLAPERDHHDLDAAEIEQGLEAPHCCTKRPFRHAAAADILAVAQLHDLGFAIERQGELVMLLAVERGG